MKKQNNVGGKVALGAGVAALSVAAYLLLGPDGKKNRKKVGDWSEKMKKEAAAKFKKMKHVTEPIYNKVVDEISSKYMKAKGLSVEEVGEVVKDLKKHWKTISKAPGKVVTATKKKATRVTKKAVKKTAKK
ncbi:MAG: hypothetical protein QG583_286 [Patescibacteria group bacterium]|nr:hypothetical protein [Patescibacteria group bacterium]